jgi:hypothetical protein
MIMSSANTKAAVKFQLADLTTSEVAALGGVGWFFSEAATAFVQQLRDTLVEEIDLTDDLLDPSLYDRQYDLLDQCVAVGSYEVWEVFTSLQGWRLDVETELTCEDGLTEVARAVLIEFAYNVVSGLLQQVRDIVDELTPEDDE